MILVTGASGLVGTHLLLELLQNSQQAIRIILRNDKSLKKLKHFIEKKGFNFDKLNNRLNIIYGDIRDYQIMSEAMEGVETVYHVAALVKFINKGKKLMDQINIQATKQIVNLALKLKIKQLCYVSSIATLGWRENNFIDENVYGNPDESLLYYGRTKFFAEMEVWRAIQEGLNAVIVNPSIIVGYTPNCNNIINYFYWLVKNKIPFYVEGINGFVSAKDVARSMIKLIENQKFGERFIISESNYSYKQVLELVAKKSGKKIPNKKLSNSMIKFLNKFSEIISKGTFNLIPDISPLFKYMTKINRYKAEKLKNAINLEFEPLERSVEEILKLCYE